MNKVSNLKLFKDWLERNEPRLTADEKRLLWQKIIALYEQNTHEPRHLWWQWVAAASITLLLIVGGWHLVNNVQHNDQDRNTMLSQLDVSTIQNIKLMAGDQVITLDDNCTITCKPGQGVININLQGNQVTTSCKPGTQLMVAVPRAARARVVLSDGSTITLRENSKMTFPFSLATVDVRRVKIEGEAYMDITHNPRKDFIAQCGDLQVKVLGTKFLISSYPGENKQCVTLYEGRVNVKTAGNKSHTLKPKETLEYLASNQQTNVIEENDIDMQTLVSWKDDIIILNNEPLTKLIEQMENIYHTQFTFNRKATDAIVLSGKFDASVSLDEFMQRLQMIAPISYHKETHTIKVTK